MQPKRSPHLLIRWQGQPAEMLRTPLHRRALHHFDFFGRDGPHELQASAGRYVVQSSDLASSTKQDSQQAKPGFPAGWAHRCAANSLVVLSQQRNAHKLQQCIGQHACKQRAAWHGLACTWYSYDCSSSKLRSFHPHAAVAIRPHLYLSSQELAAWCIAHLKLHEHV